jgi:preprotein translocase subunit SecB
MLAKVTNITMRSATMSKSPKPAPKKAAPKQESSNSQQAVSAGKTVEPAAAPASGTQQPQAQPSVRVLGQYLKDLSFENPNAPQSLAPQETQPDINISVNVNARNLTPTDYEVELHLNAKATLQDKVIFAAELVYAGTFRMENFPAQLLHPAVLIECPRILFPFARQVLADATRNGGFPPLMLDPIDFTSMYQKRVQQQQQAAAKS